MKIIKCPYCAQLVHFDGPRQKRRCWNCDYVTDFSRPMNGVERLEARLRYGFDSALPDMSLLRKASRLALGAGLSLAVVMLLVCNSLDVHIVHDPAEPFAVLNGFSDLDRDGNPVFDARQSPIVN